MADTYANLREFLGRFIGQRLVEVTQHDVEEFMPGGTSDVYLHFEQGETLHFWIGDDGFEVLGANDDNDDPPTETPTAVAED